MKVIIVGGVAGGATAAARLRRLNEKAEIIIMERGGHVSFANCGLPYYLGGVIKHRESLLLHTPKSFLERYNVDVRLGNEVVGIRPEKKELIIKKVETGEEYRERYDRLILSPGASPIVPPVKGRDLPGIFTLRNIPDTLAIEEFIKTNSPKEAVVVGGGYIGLEVAENLKHAGINVTVVELMDHVVGPLDSEMARMVENYLSRKGIKIITGNGLKAIEQEGKDLLLKLNDGRIKAQMVLLSVGVRPDTGFLKDSGIKTDERGSILVDERLRTNVEDIYAVGDAVKIPNIVTKEDMMIALAGPANKQGRLVADEISGLGMDYDGALGTSIIKLFEMTVATTGINERQAKQANMNYERLLISAPAHAGYYPGGRDMFLKVLWDKDNHQILGGQIVGFEGVDKRIDVLATSIMLKAKITDLMRLDLAYAPPFGSAKDPINMVGYVAQNIIAGRLKQAFWDELEKIKANNSTILLDVRTDEEAIKGMIPGAIHVPYEKLREKVEKLPKGTAVYIYCFSGVRSYEACQLLDKLGYTTYNLSGGWRAFVSMTSKKSE